LFALAALLVTPITVAAMQAPPQKPEGKHEEGKKEQEDKLEGLMQTLQGGTKRLDKAFDKKDAAAVLKTAVDMQRAVQDAKLETPPKAGEISDAKQKDEFVKGFRKQMITLQRALLDLETAALDDKLDEAAKIFNATIKPLRKTGTTSTRALIVVLCAGNRAGGALSFRRGFRRARGFARGAHE
jgi:phage host-nuclease inhibitor protein Gam